MKLSVTNDSRRICTAVMEVVSLLVTSALYHVLSVTLCGKLRASTALGSQGVTKTRPTNVSAVDDEAIVSHAKVGQLLCSRGKA